MATKDERLEMRLSKSDRTLLEEAADHLHESVSDFTRNAALNHARHVLARAETVLMPAEQFDAMVASLDAADEMSYLAQVLERPRRFKRG